MGEILTALIGSTLTPVVVFLPLAYLSGMAGVFFRALGLTMVVSLLVSLALAVTLTPSLAAWLIRGRVTATPGRTANGAHGASRPQDEAGFVLAAGAADLRSRRALGVAARVADVAGLRVGFRRRHFHFPAIGDGLSAGF